MKTLAIIGAGSSGLIALKTALGHLPDWKITCIEKSDSIRGCWGNPYPGFISTSTKYTTQFSCFQKFDASLDPKRQMDEFFKGGEYGEYLEEFAQEFRLHPHIQLNNTVLSVTKESDGEWLVKTESSAETYSQVIVCTGLTEKPKPLDCAIPSIRTMQEVNTVRDQTVVIMGGGESAADLANRLAHPEKKNTVFLSLKGGIRVSPRYHPIKGVPSDFLRNRLMLGISQNLRNTIGQKFVETRIKYQELLEKLFPQKQSSSKNCPVSQKRKEWDFRLTKASKDNLFNMFHNKSDGFLDAVGEGRIQIIGSPVDEDFLEFHEFESTETRTLQPDLIVPMIGYQSALASLFSEKVQVPDFYLGCTHAENENLHLIGFARPIIGNIPSISEQQARYIIKSISGEVQRPPNIIDLHKNERSRLAKQFPKLNREAIYPVEMFPYCDTLAKLMKTYPDEESKNMLQSPASTLHYTNYQTSPAQIYTPKVLNFLLKVVKRFDSYS